MPDGNGTESDGISRMSDGNFRPVRLTPRERVIAAFLVGLYIGSTTVVLLVAHGILRVYP